MTDQGLVVRLTLGDSFLDAFVNLPSGIQKKVKTMIENFQNNPTGTGLNYESIAGAADSTLRSIRLDQKYRAIVKKPEKGNLYFLLWVDNHDDAYAWARNRRVDVHPDTGAIQIYTTKYLEAKAVETATGSERKGLFLKYKDRQLRRLGVPVGLIPLLREIETEEDFIAREEEFPSEASEALYSLACGYSYEDIVRELEIPEPTSVDTQDFGLALENPDTLRRFHVVDDAVELQEILNSPLEKWRVFLHPSQRKLVRWNVNGPIRVLGGAGTGKTVVAMHRARWLASQLGRGSERRILFTTFTRNLVTDIQENLRNLCTPDELRKIEVINLDAWVKRFLGTQGYECRLDYEVSKDTLRILWENALNLAPASLGFPDKFYRDEWEQVIQAHGISTLQEYIKVPRTGRGRRLNRLQRKDVWPVFEEYRASLNRENIREKEDAFRDARRILEQKGDILNFRSVVVDEAQDLSAEAFRLIRQIVPPTRSDPTNDLFIVGDAHQRIYGSRIVLSHCGIDIRGRGRRLKINYRTTEETSRWAVSLLEGRSIDDLDGGLDTTQGYLSLMHGERPKVRVFNSWGEELDFIDRLLKKLIQNGVPDSNICLVARTHDMLEGYVDALKDRGHKMHEIVTRDKRGVGGIRNGTMHRVKGIEFDYMIVAGVDDGTLPLTSVMADLDNPFAEEETENRERALLYVSVTRAKKQAFVTSSGVPSRFIT